MFRIWGSGYEVTHNGSSYCKSVSYPGYSKLKEWLLVKENNGFGLITRLKAIFNAITFLFKMLGMGLIIYYLFPLAHQYLAHSK